MHCMTCQGRGVMLLGPKGYPLPINENLYSQRLHDAKPCTRCKKGRLIKKFKLLEKATDLRNSSGVGILYRCELKKVISTVENMDMKNGMLR